MYLLRKEITDFSGHYVAFGIFTLVNSLSPIFFTHSYSLQSFFIIEITLKFFSGIMCIGLVLYDIWPTFLKCRKELYWHVALIYILPFLSSFIVLLSNFNNFFVTNLALSIFLLAILSDWQNFINRLIIGVISSVLFYLLSFKVTYLTLDYRIIETSYVCIFSVIISLFFCKKKQKEQELREKNIYLLASSIAHEVRTPLSTLLGNVKLLQKHDNQYQKDVIENIKNNIKQCHENINSILVSFRQENIIEIQLESFSSLVLEIIKNYPYRKQEKKLIVENIKDSRKYIRVNRVLLKQVINNLISNALYSIKTAKKGKIYITLRSGSKIARISVKDTGTGMTDTVLKNVFVPFSTNKNCGNGIGLAYSKNTIDRMGGTMSCISVEKKFVQFIIEFPSV